MIKSKGRQEKFNVRKTREFNYAEKNGDMKAYLYALKSLLEIIFVILQVLYRAALNLHSYFTISEMTSLHIKLFV